MNWLEISLSVESELAEAVADVLSRHIQHGIATELIIDEQSQRATSNHILVRGYLPVDGTEEDLKNLIVQDLWHLRQIQDFPDPTFELVQQMDWSEQWHQHYYPLPIGEKLLIVPAWYEPIENPRIALLLEPGMAFGTGTHPTTRMCLQAIEDHIRPGDRVYDIGCGSGILSIASLLLGAREAVALDIDPDAVQSTADNADRNQVSEHINLISGSLADLFSGETIDPTPGDLVVANILTTRIIKMVQAGLTKLLAPGAKLILSGILFDQTDEIMQAIKEHDLELIEVRAENDWRAMVFKKKELPPRRGNSHLEDSGG